MLELLLTRLLVALERICVLRLCYVGLACRVGCLIWHRVEVTSWGRAMRLVFRLRCVGTARSLALHLILIHVGFELKVGFQKRFYLFLHGELILSLTFFYQSQLSLFLLELQLETVTFQQQVI